jgi:hypothetical protein
MKRRFIPQDIRLSHYNDELAVLAMVAAIDEDKQEWGLK